MLTLKDMLRVARMMEQTGRNPISGVQTDLTPPYKGRFCSKRERRKRGDGKVISFEVDYS